MLLKIREQVKVHHIFQADVLRKDGQVLTFLPLLILSLDDGFVGGGLPHSGSAEDNLCGARH
jgi:hypothetical protein